MKTVMISLLLMVLASLAGAGMYMLRKDDDSGDRRSARMARALALRVALSVLLFLFILISWKMGWVRPGGLPVAV
jgi:cytochrome bd-type quinol oxidase subunit 2